MAHVVGSFCQWKSEMRNIRGIEASNTLKMGLK